MPRDMLRQAALIISDDILKILLMFRKMRIAHGIHISVTIQIKELQKGNHKFARGWFRQFHRERDAHE